MQPDAANDLAHAQLADKLQKQGLQAIEGSGSEEGTHRPSEKSYFAFGLADPDTSSTAANQEIDMPVITLKSAKANAMECVLAQTVRGFSERGEWSHHHR